MKNYCIKEGYQINTDVPHFDDTPFKDEFQKHIYQFAAHQLRVSDCRRVIDLGCGSAYKLHNSFPYGVELCGVEVPPTLDWLRKKYPRGQWYAFGTILWRRRQLEGNPLKTMLVCSDVIEHIPDPDVLLDYILRLRPDLIVLSTPDRNHLGLGTENGPPRNRHHVREWCTVELAEYLSGKFELLHVKSGPTTLVLMRPKKEAVCE